MDRELNRALDWLEGEGVRRVIVTSDFLLSTQLVGADTADFFSALDDIEERLAITSGWPATARRLHDDFAVSVGFVPRKRLLGGMLELLMNCHPLVAVEDARLGWPEVSLPVVPGMEGCHWPFRRAPRDRGAAGVPPVHRGLLPRERDRGAHGAGAPRRGVPSLARLSRRPGGRGAGANDERPDQLIVA